MKLQTLTTAAILASATFVVGCDDGSTAPAETTPAETANTPSPSRPGGNALDATNQVLNQADTAGQKAMDQATDTGQQMKAQGNNAMDRLKQSATTASDDMQGQAQGMMSGLSLDQFKDGMSLTPQQTDAIIEQVKKLVGDGNMDQARAWVDKLDSMQLPQGYDEKVTSLKNMLE